MKYKALFWVSVFALIGVGVMAPSHRAAEGAWILHDDFNDPSLFVRQDLWNTSSSDTSIGFSGGRGTTEAVRIIDGKLLEALGLVPPSDPRLLIGRRFGARAGATAAFDSAHYFTRSQNTNGIRADVTMKSCIVEDGRVQARVAGFFGEGSPTSSPLDLTNDVFVALRVECLSTNQPEIMWAAAQCIDAACNTLNIIGSNTFGPATLGQPHTLSIRKVGSMVELTADGVMQQLALPGNATGAPNGPFLRIGQRMTLSTPANGGELIGISCYDNVFLDDGQ